MTQLDRPQVLERSPINHNRKLVWIFRSDGDCSGGARVKQDEAGQTVREGRAETQQTVPDQAHKPIARPTLRRLLQYFEGIDLLHIAQPDGSRVTEILRLDRVHRLVLHLLGRPMKTVI